MDRSSNSQLFAAVFLIGVLVFLSPCVMAIRTTVAPFPSLHAFRSPSFNYKPYFPDRSDCAHKHIRPQIDLQLLPGELRAENLANRSKTKNLALPLSGRGDRGMSGGYVDSTRFDGICAVVLLPSHVPPLPMFGGSVRPSSLVPFPLAGEILVVEKFNHVVMRLGRDHILTLAGRTRNPGYVDSHGFASQFNEPTHISLDTNRIRLLVADRFNRKIRAVNLSTYRVSTLVNLSSEPRFIATAVDDKDAHILSFNNASICSFPVTADPAITPATATRSCGDPEAVTSLYADGNCSIGSARFSLELRAMVSDTRRGVFWIAEGGSFSTIRRIDSWYGHVVTVVGSPNSPVSPASVLSDVFSVSDLLNSKRSILGSPSSLLLDGVGNLVVTEANYSLIRLIRIRSDDVIYDTDNAKDIIVPTPYSIETIIGNPNSVPQGTLNGANATYFGRPVYDPQDQSTETNLLRRQMPLTERNSLAGLFFCLLLKSSGTLLAFFIGRVPGEGVLTDHTTRRLRMARE